mgnify:CR=1 FL=1
MARCMCCTKDQKLTRPVELPIKITGVVCASCELHGGKRVSIMISLDCPNKPTDAQPETPAPDPLVAPPGGMNPSPLGTETASQG